MGTALLDWIIQQQNQSGTVKGAPPALKKLKESLNGLPFELLKPSMSGLMSIQNLTSGLTQLSQMLGGFGGLGSLVSLMGQSAGAGKGATTALSSLSPDQIIAAVGGGNALSAALIGSQGGGS